jgi:hypothetical protein
MEYQLEVDEVHDKQAYEYAVGSHFAERLSRYGNEA